MTLDQKEIDSVISNNLLIDFVKITLTQDTTDSPKKYSGPGSISLDKDGLLRLKIYHVYEVEEEIERDFLDSFNDGGLIPGQIIGNQHYYFLEALDMKGRSWTSSHVSISGHTSFPARGKVIETNLQKISLTHEPIEGEKSQNDFAYLIIPGKHKVPCNKYEKSEKGTSLTICELNLDHYCCEIKKRESHIELSIRGTSELAIEKQSNILLEAISICTGSFLRPKIRLVSSKDCKVSEIYSARQSSAKQELQPPIDGMNARETSFFEEFTKKYTRKVCEPYAELFGYWYRIFSESSGELENRALVLTTSIEGVLKQYYADYGTPDSEFITQVQEAKPTIKSLEVGERVKQRILSSLGNALSSTPKNSLHSLAASKDIPGELIKIWSELRNKSAHADELKQSDSELQEFLDQLFGCLELFYCLLLRHIEYKGNYIRYSQIGWPAALMS